MSVVFLFPGQGEQRPGMLRDLHSESTSGSSPVPEDGTGFENGVDCEEFAEIAVETLREAFQALGEDPLVLDRATADTRDAQLALLIAGVLGYRQVQRRDAVPDYAAGHSVGAFTAAVAAGSLEFADAVRLVDLRGRGMRAVCPSGYGMGVITGLSLDQVAALTDDIRTHGGCVFPANVNSASQVVISGSVDALEQTYAAALNAGAAAARSLDVAVASHTPLMSDVAADLEQALSLTTVRRPRFPLAGNADGRTLRSAQAVREDLARSVAAPVRWAEATGVLHERGARLFLQINPGHALSQLAGEAFADARSVAVEDFGIDNSARLVRRWR